MTESGERFKHRSLARVRGASRIMIVHDGDTVRKHLESEADHDRVAAFASQIESAHQIDADALTVDPVVVNALLADIRGKFDRQRFQALVGDIRRSTLQAVTGPLGFGYAVSGLQAFDNARKPCPSFQPGAPGNKTVIVLSAPGRQEEAAGRPAAGQTGEHLKDLIREGHARDRSRFPSPDLADYPIVNASDEIIYPANNDRKKSEADIAKVTYPDNLTRLKAQIGDADTVVSLGGNATAAVDELARNHGLKTERMTGQHPSPKVINKIKTDKPPKTEEAKQDRLAQYREKVFASLTGEMPTGVQRTVERGARAAKTGGGMAKQQVISSVLTDFTVAMFDELGDCWQRGVTVNDEGIAGAISLRSKKVCRRILKKWRVFLGAGLMGLVSGFLSEITNILIGTVRNIGARLARIVRDGIASLLRALQMVLFPPPGQTTEETWHEATKLMAAGVLTAGGIALEGVVAQALPGLDFITGPVVAITTGLAIAAAMYGLDKLDLFGAITERRHAFTLQELDQMVAKSLDGHEKLEADVPMPLMR